ncbi:hypothetical protein EWM64_g9630 [Hericium alpestre]|uniref:Uncharacterized protein n=1 Tax=Hericium alpestre TaxID=135208 RepID=A0A4Y9ZIA4_9AGAM|nr:hypothetical protein EWM64_g9630 [Hericium alpestre]
MQAYFAAPSENIPSRFLAPPAAPSRKPSQRVSGLRDDVDDFLSSDLELSFASTMSLNSPPREAISIALESDIEHVPMDISPAVPRTSRPSSTLSVKPTTRPRALTSGARLFGRDVSNDSLPSPVPASIKSGSSQGKRTQRSALPMEWMQYKHEQQPVEHEPQETQYTVPEIIAHSSDAMDVDMSFTVPVNDALLSSPEPLSAAPTITGFNNLFFGIMSPTRDDSTLANPKKRRSTSPEKLIGRRRAGTVVLDSSPGFQSPSCLKLERMNKPTLGGLREPSQNKRTRRPALSAMVPPSGSSRSAHPTAEQENQAPPLLKAQLPPPRRAFSAMMPLGALGDSFSDESSFEHSSPAQHMRSASM